MDILDRGGDLTGHADTRVALTDLDLGEAGAGKQLGQILDIGGVDIDLGHCCLWSEPAPASGQTQWPRQGDGVMATGAAPLCIVPESRERMPIGWAGRVAHGEHTKRVHGQRSFRPVQGLGSAWDARKPALRAGSRQHEAATYSTAPS